MNPVYQHRLDNGLWLLAEPIAGAQSLAMSLLLPAGVASELEGQQGVATMLSEMIFRGAGTLDARAHSDALDLLGVDRGSSVESRHLRLGAAMIGSKLPRALPLLFDMVRSPLLAEDAIEPSRDLALQAIASLEDEPQDKALIELRQRHFPAPVNRSTLGQTEHIRRLAVEDVRDYWRRTFVPGGAVLGFAGRFDWQQLKEMVESLLGDWRGGFDEPPLQNSSPRDYVNQQAQSAQVHIGLAYDAVPEIDQRSILQRTAVAVLSGGMSGRLFTEVREKRGLCYAVSARYSGDKQLGAVLCYAGTTAPRAQETLDVLVEELKRLSRGVEPEEFQRAVVGMKSSLVMQGESTSARASRIAIDQYLYGKPRTLHEMAARVDAITLDGLNEFIRGHLPGPMTVVTVGPEQLAIS